MMWSPDGATVTDLNTLVAGQLPAGAVLTGAGKITDSGFILAYSWNGNSPAARRRLPPHAGDQDQHYDLLTGKHHVCRAAAAVKRQSHGCERCDPSRQRQLVRQRKIGWDYTTDGHRNVHLPIHRMGTWTAQDNGDLHGEVTDGIELLGSAATPDHCYAH